MKRTRRQAKAPLYQYVIPRDEDRVITESVALGSVCALRDYPEYKSRDQLDTEARAALVKSRMQKHTALTNDFAALCSVYIPHFIYGYENTMQKYSTDPSRWEENKALLADHGWSTMLIAHQQRCMDTLAAIKEDMAAFFPAT